MTLLETPTAGARLTAAPTPDLPTHLAVHGPLPDWSPERLLEEVRLSGLTGRGGAGFPTAVKMAAVAGARGAAVVVGNGSESEPGSLKDRQMLLAAPHLVIDGLQAAARAVGAREAVLYVRADTVAAVRSAVAARGAADATPVRVVEAARGFVAGQESAVVSALEGGPAVPVFRRHRVTERGVHGRPTLVQNVETLAQLALVARHGGAWFASGTVLLTVHPVGSPAGVWEVPHGIPLGSMLESVAATVPGHPPVSAVLVGGYHGTWLPWPAAARAPLSAEGLRPFGGALGAGVVILLPSTRCGWETTANIVRWLADESAGQCGPCRFGLPHLAGLATKLAEGTADAAGLEDLRAAVGLVEGRGACSHPDGAARLVRSALQTFEADARWHVAGHCLTRTTGVTR